MNEPTNNKHVLIFTDNGFRYTGIIIEQDETFITITDDKKGRTILLNKKNITTIEVQE